MATTQPKAGLVETTITAGTGSYLLQGPLSGWRGFTAGDDGKVFTYGVYQDGGGFEEGKGTYNHAARTLSRSTISGNHLNTGSPIDWGSGSKEVSNVLSAAETVMTSVENKFAADQFLRAFKLFLDSDDDTWLSAATDDVVRLFLASVEVLKIEQGKLTFSSADDTATEGPELLLDRQSASAAVNDALAVFRMSGRDTNQNVITAFKFRPRLTSVTPGDHSSSVAFDIAKAGALQPVLQFQPDAVSVLANVALYSNSKTAFNLNAVGAEFHPTGEVIGVALNSPSGLFQRKGSDGAIIEVGRDGVTQGTVSLAGTTVTWGGFTGHHWVEWAPGFDGESFEVLGTVVQTADGMLTSSPDPVKYVHPASNGSRRVYGVIGGRQITKIVNNEERPLLLMFALGNGWIRTFGMVRDGNLLWASSSPGLAEPQLDQDHVGPWTIAKAIGDSENDLGESLVPCVYMAG